MPTITINDLFPAFVGELSRLVSEAGHPHLSEQIPSLPVVARCNCAQDNCAHFYTAPPPRGAYPPNHTNILLPTDDGLIVVDVIEDRIVAVEILDRPDVKQLLDKALPVVAA